MNDPAGFFPDCKWLCTVTGYVGKIISLVPKETEAKPN